jgi:hypothetical protein
MIGRDRDADAAAGVAAAVNPCKANDGARFFCHAYMPGCNLINRQPNRVWVRQQRFSIPRVAEKRDTLQVLERLPFRGKGESTRQGQRHDDDSTD